jgi:hypothetical protein
MTPAAVAGRPPRACYIRAMLSTPSALFALALLGALRVR